MGKQCFWLHLQNNRILFIFCCIFHIYEAKASHSVCIVQTLEYKDVFMIIKKRKESFLML